MYTRLSILILLCSSACLADVRLPKILSSNAVLQQDTDVKIWGWADPGEAIRVSTSWLEHAQEFQAAADGTWQIKLRTNVADNDESHTITVQGNNLVTLENVRFGEVWLASGQSNMEMPLVAVSGAYTGIHNAKQEILAAANPNIVLFQVGNFSSDRPLDEVQPGIEMYGIPGAACRWQTSSPETVSHFASTAYFFARELQRELQVPIGIIDASWGGTSAEAWTPLDGLEQLAGFEDDVRVAKSRPQKADQKTPARLYNGMIHPLRKLTIQGVIWYQGEGNTGEAQHYERLFGTMIQQWRAAWDLDFPFYFVQISPFQYKNVNAAFLREAQLKTLSLPGTAMAVTMDIGNLSDIHPKNKQIVGKRLALCALAKDYGRRVVYSGPIYRQNIVEGHQIRLQFDHIADGLVTSDGQPPSHFEVAGLDRQFHPAVAKIEGSEIVVSSPAVEAPLAARYAFTSDAMPNLRNKSGLPASSFRTDDW